MSGFAGSGKTFLSIKFLELIENKNLCWTVVAPTHKAVGVLRNVLNDVGLKPTWNPSTIHRLLRLKLNRTGNLEICEETKKTEKSLENIDLLLVDEASMITSTLLEILLKYAYRYRTRLVFVGDPAQLPPIGETISPLFLISKTHKAHLTEVIRHQGPVLKLATILRQDEFPCTPPSCFPTFSNQKGSVGCLSNKDWLEKAQFELKEAARKNDPDSARILCYTNRYVERLVPYARRAIHGQDADMMPVLPGELLITRKAVMLTATIDRVRFFEEPGVLFGSNEEMLVKDVSPHSYDLQELELSENIFFDVPSIETLLIKVFCRNMEFSIRLLPELGSYARNELDEFLGKISHKAKNCYGVDSRKLWKTFFRVRDSFASLGPASVLTVHRSQGSTFGEVFIASDVFWPKDIKLRKQLAYVAISRASKGVWLLDSSENQYGDNIWRENMNLILKDSA